MSDTPTPQIFLTEGMQVPANLDPAIQVVFTPPPATQSAANSTSSHVALHPPREVFNDLMDLLNSLADDPGYYSSGIDEATSNRAKAARDFLRADVPEVPQA